jgi:very-short-patch-repair endonuclease
VYEYNKASLKPRRRSLRKEPTGPEKLLWSKIRSRQVRGYKFRRQHSVGNFVIDFYCTELKLAVELDGESHFIPGATKQDNTRQQSIEKFGITFLRFSNTDVVKSLEGVWHTILQTAEKLKRKQDQTTRRAPPSIPP